jgi:POT family proton-dependent oligopeptide transporter
MLGPLNGVQVVSLGSLLLIPACYFLIQQNSWMTPLLLILFGYVVYTLLSSGIREDKEQGVSIWKDRMIALIILMLVNIAFWACFEQAGTSLTLFADRNVDKMVFGWEMPAAMTQFFNPLFIIIFGSIFSVLWVKLAKIGKNPSIPQKFALAFVQLGLGFLVTMVGLQFVDGAFQVPLLTLVVLYLLHTTGELCISPIGLSMVTKLAPKKIAGAAMGAWFLSFAGANYVGGIIASLTGGHGGGEEVLSASETLANSTEVFEILGYVLLGIAALVFILNRPIKKLMHGVE